METRLTPAQLATLAGFDSRWRQLPHLISFRNCDPSHLPVLLKQELIECRFMIENNYRLTDRGQEALWAYGFEMQRTQPARQKWTYCDRCRSWHLEAVCRR